MKEIRKSRSPNQHTEIAARDFNALRISFCKGVLAVHPKWGRLQTHWNTTLQSVGVEEKGLSQFALPAGEVMIRGFPRNVAALRQQVIATAQMLNLLGINYYQAMSGLSGMLDIYLRQVKAAGVKPEPIMLAATRLYLLVSGLLATAFAHQADTEVLLHEDELRQVAAVLSDDIAQDLGALKLHLESAWLTLEGGKTVGTRVEVNKALRVASHALQATRRTIVELGSAMIRRLGLLSACRIYARQFSARTGIDIELIVEQSPEDIPIEHQMALYRAMQIALNDISSACRVRQVQVIFHRWKNSAFMEVKFRNGQLAAALRKPLQNDIRINTLRQTMRSVGGKVYIRFPFAEGKPRVRTGQIEVQLPETA